MAEQPVTLITGARKGIGRFLADHYARQGHIVVGCSRARPDEETPPYDHFSVDVADEKAVRAMMDAVWDKYGRLDHLINNAGIAATNHFLMTSAQTAADVYRTNLLGTFLVSREGAKLMTKRRFGRIVNFSSVASPLKLAGEALYASSKAAVESLTGVLARELGPFGITVNAVGPTPVETDLIAAMRPEKVQDVIARQAVRRRGTCADIANAVDFFLQPKSDFVTGQVLYLGGC